MNTRTKWIIAIAAFILSLGLLIFSYVYKGRNQSNIKATNLPTMTITELAKFDGSDAQLPIYIGLNGYVYDVTPGKEYYVTGGTYHYLAGKDSSSELNLIGGDIIVRKYKVVAILTK